jgi:hypothetical protein
VIADGSLLLLKVFIAELIWVPFLSRRQSVSNNFTVDLAVLKELSQELAELFSLTLPISLKK